MNNWNNGFYRYEYDTAKEKVSQKLTFASIGNLLNIVVEGGYLFGISSSEGLISIDLATGEKLTWASGVYAMFGNDLQFYRGNLFVRNMTRAQEILQVLVVDKDGGLRRRSGILTLPWQMGQRMNNIQMGLGRRRGKTV